MAKIVFVSLCAPFSLAVQYLSSYLLKNGHTVHALCLKEDTFDSIREIWTPREKTSGFQQYYKNKLLCSSLDASPVSDLEFALLARELQRHAPDIIGLTSRAFMDDIIPRLTEVCREAAPTALIVAGGHGASMSPEHYLESGVDLVVRGDGEEALLDIANNIDNPAICHALPNVSTRTCGGFLHNPLRPQEKNLDKYPFPLQEKEFYTLIENNRVEKEYDILESVRRSYSTVLGRGCVGKCTYCTSSTWDDLYRQSGCKVRKVRNRSVIHIMRELEANNHRMNFVVFQDDFLTLPMQQAFDLFRQYKEKINKPFWCYFNYQQILAHPDLLHLAWEAGLDSTGVGVQSAAEELARTCYARSFANSSYLAYSNMLFEHDVFNSVMLIGGNCYETEEHFQQNLDFVKTLPFSLEDLSLNALACSRLHVLPQAPIGKLFPRVVTHPMPAKEWLYHACLTELARITDEDEFAAIREEKAFKKCPSLLMVEYENLLFAKRREYYEKLVQSLKHERVFFYGNGKTYEANKDLFSEITPEAVFVDDTFHDGNNHVLKKSDVIHNIGDAKIFIFSQNATRMRRQLVMRDKLVKSNIFLCTSDLTDNAKYYTLKRINHLKYTSA